MGFKWEELLINLGDKKNHVWSFQILFRSLEKGRKPNTHGFGNNREVTKSKKRHENGTPHPNG